MRSRTPVAIVAPALVAIVATGLLLTIASMPVGESRPPSARPSATGMLASSPGEGAGEATASPAASTAAIATSSPRAPSPSPRAGSPTVRPQPTRASTPTPAPGSGWTLVVNDQFNSGGVPSHWGVYEGRYGSGAQNCTAPSHVFVAGGVLHLILSYEASGGGGCGPGWYSGGLALDGFSSIDQQVTVRFRVVDSSPAISGHFIIPMRWPDSDAAWPAAGEEDYCEGDALAGCSTYLHFGSTDQQLAHAFGFDVRNWHTIRVERRSHVVRVFVDSMAAPVWTYVGTSATLPDTLKHVVLQQECQSTCPSSTSGSEDIQIDWITVANPT